MTWDSILASSLWSNVSLSSKLHRNAAWWPFRTPWRANRPVALSARLFLLVLIRSRLLRRLPCRWAFARGRQRCLQSPAWPFHSRRRTRPRPSCHHFHRHALPASAATTASTARRCPAGSQTAHDSLPGLPRGQLRSTIQVSLHRKIDALPWLPDLSRDREKKTEFSCCFYFEEVQAKLRSIGVKLK